MKKVSKHLLFLLLTTVLALGTVIFLGFALKERLSTPHEISSKKGLQGYNFTVVAMKDDKPVEMLHQWSSTVRFDEGSLAPKDRAFLQSGMKYPIIWADTGRAIGNYRYYLTSSDLPLISSRLNSKSGENPHEVRVKILEDDIVNKRQTLQLIVMGDDTDFKNIYEVKNNSIRPLKWSRYRAMSLIPFAMVSPFLLIGLIYFWGKILERYFFPRRGRGLASQSSEV